jgi:ectoine hydroxylase
VKSIPPSDVPSAAELRLASDELARLAADGYIVRVAVFTPAEVDAIVGACEDLVAELVRDRRGNRLQAGSYVFDPDFTRSVIIKWEGDSDVVHGIEPCAHLSPALHGWATDNRFLTPMQDFVGDSAPELFTEKLNLKRPERGGVNPLHQDYPYWVGVAYDPATVATAMLFLDDSTLENGCLRVVPGSHTNGVWDRRTDGSPFLGNEIDATAYPGVESVPIECAAGTVVMFGSYLVHHSEPNRSDRQRRALLFSYQPAGRAHMLDALRKLAPDRRA